MPHFNIIKTAEPKKSFRVASVMGKFDLESNEIKEHFQGNIDIDNNWQIGLIVGRSGSGKTTIAKQLFPDSYITNFTYSAETILDDMPKECSVEDITKAFNSVGFSSPPSWLKPYSVLSNGEKMRVDLARAILSKDNLFVFDEFTSVVDRNVAQVGSYAMQKAIRKSTKQFIAVTCHYDVEDWLLPDWVFDTDSMTFRKCEGQKKNKPTVNFEIFQTNDKSIWKVFAKHHYLSHTHNNAAQVYVAYVNDQLAGFISVFHFPHPKVKNFKAVHRLVILPDYQGLGIGVRLLNEVGKLYKQEKWRFIITTSAPSLMFALKKSSLWVLKQFGRKPPQNINTGNPISTRKSDSSNRLTTSWEMV